VPQSPALRAALVERVITPEPGCRLTGFIARTGPSIDVHDDLYARMLLLEHEGRRLALIMVDMLGTDIPTATALREKVAAVVQTPPGCVMLNATHTHAGPATIELLGIAPVDADFIKHLEGVLCELAAKAAADLEPAVLRHRRGRSTGVGLIRRWPGQKPAPHPLDDTLDVLTIERPSGAPMGMVISTPCHAVAAGWTRSISADFPGAMVRELAAAHPGQVVAFAQGCCGDINPVAGVRDHDAAEEAGRALAQAVQATFGRASPTCLAGPLGAASRRVVLQYFYPPPRDELLALDAKSRQPEADAADKAMGQFARRTLETIDSGRMPAGVEVPVQVFAIGQEPCLRIVGLPGEPLSTLGMIVRNASPDPTIVLGYCNGLMGYVADRQSYDDAGYEIETSFRYYGNPARFAPGAGEELAAAAIRLCAEQRENAKAQRR
jgi:neutral ceramidase